MKLPPLAIVVFLLSSSAANSSPRHRRTLSATTTTLSATTKKPASVAGFLYFRLSITRPTALFLPAGPTFPAPLAPFS